MVIAYFYQENGAIVGLYLTHVDCSIIFFDDLYKSKGLFL